MKRSQEPTYSFVILTLVLIVVNTLLAKLSVTLLPFGESGISVLYFAVAFMILFTIWFGAYGAIAAYVGTLIGSGLLAGGAQQIPPLVALYWALAGLFQVLIPLVAFRNFDVDPTLENKRDWTYLFLFAILINNIVGALWGACTLAFGGVIPAAEIGSVFSTWLLGNIIVTLLILPIALRRLTPKIQKSKLFVRGYWD